MTLLRIALGVGVAARSSAPSPSYHRHERHVEFAAQEDAWLCAHGRPVDVHRLRRGRI